MGWFSQIRCLFMTPTPQLYAGQAESTQNSFAQYFTGFGLVFGVLAWCLVRLLGVLIMKKVPDVLETVWWWLVGKC